MTRTRAFATDHVSGQLSMDTADEFSWSEATMVQIDHPPHETAFDTDQFYKIPLTAARPVEQTYHTVDGEVTMLKPAAELQRAAWSLDNAPITLSHPDSRIVDGVEKIHGFTRHPEWDAADESLRASAYIPVTDGEAKAWLEGHTDVSIGFWYNTDAETDTPSVDGYQRDLLVDHVAIVGEGRCSREDGCGLAADSSLFRGFTTVDERECSAGPCSCGLHTDAASYNEGDWVRWEYSGGTAVGRVETVSTGETLSVEGGSREGSEDEPAYKMQHWDDGSFGSMVVKSESELTSADEPADFESDAIAHDKSIDDLTESNDSDSDGRSAVQTDNIDLTPPEAAQSAAQDALDARDDDDITVNGMTDTGWSRAEQLASGDALDPSDLVEGQDGMAVWWSRHAGHTIDTSGDQLSLKHADAENPWSENSYTAGKGWGGVSGYTWAIRKGNEIKRARDEEPDYSRLGEDSAVTLDASTVADSSNESAIRNDASGTSREVAGVTFNDTCDGDLDESAIPNDDYEQHYLYPADTKSESSYPVVDADGCLRRGNVESAYQLGARGGVDGDEHDEKLRRLNDEFDDPPIAFDDSPTTDSTMTDDDADGQPTISVESLTVDAIADQNDAVAELIDERDELDAQLDAAKDELDSLKEEVQSYRADEKQSLVEEIRSYTQTWGEDELMEMDLDALETRLDAAKEIAADVAPTEPTETGGGDDPDGDGFGTDSRESVSTYSSGNVYDLADTA